MGKARIVSGGTEGSYTVEVLHNRERIDDEIAVIDFRLEQLGPKLLDAEERLRYAELEVAEAKMLADALIDLFEEEGALPPVDLPALIDLHNGVRESKGLPAFALSSSLNAAAQGHAEWLAANNASGHTGANGSSPSQRISGAGYVGANSENVAVGVVPPESEPLDRWMRSPGHRSNILNESFRHIGAGYACRTEGTYRHFWVVCFGGSLDDVPAGSPSAPDACEGGSADTPERIQEAIEELAEKARARDIIRLEMTALESDKLGDELRKKQLQAIPHDPIQQAWCADYTETLTGEVGTAEIPGEGNTRLIVRPGYSGRATIDPARDGQLFHRGGMTGAQAYFNAAILPGWQRWKPTYRVGVIGNINTASDTCTVTLDNDVSSAQALGINQPGALTGVPVEYMDCGAHVFEIGDRVLVQFVGQSWASPKVVGFESNPRECWPEFIFVRVSMQVDDIAFEDFDRAEVFGEIRSTCCGDAWNIGIPSPAPAASRARHFLVRQIDDDEGEPLSEEFVTGFGAVSAESPFMLYSVADTWFFNNATLPNPQTWDLSPAETFRVLRTDYAWAGPLTYNARNLCNTGTCTWNSTNELTGYVVFGITTHSGSDLPDPWDAPVTFVASFNLADYGSSAAWSTAVVTWLVGNTNLPSETVLTKGGASKVYEVDYEGYEWKSASSAGFVKYRIKPSGA